MARLEKVECILFRKQGDEYGFLLLKCTPARGGIWQPITGNIDAADASLLDAAYREIREETGISKECILRVFENVHQFDLTLARKGRTPEQFTEHAFGFEVQPDAAIRIDMNADEEHEEFAWLPFNEAMQRIHWNDNKNALRKLHELLAGAHASQSPKEA